jgi:hypothetical protein
MAARKIGRIALTLPTIANIFEIFAAADARQIVVDLVDAQ